MHFSIVQLITIREHRDCLQLKVIAVSSFYVAQYITYLQLQCNRPL